MVRTSNWKDPINSNKNIYIFCSSSIGVTNHFCNQIFLQGDISRHWKRKNKFYPSASKLTDQVLDFLHRKILCYSRSIPHSTESSLQTKYSYRRWNHNHIFGQLLQQRQILYFLSNVHRSTTIFIFPTLFLSIYGLFLQKTGIWQANQEEHYR